MSFSATLVRNITGLGNPVTKSTEHTEGASINISEAIPIQANYQIALDLDVAEIEMVYFVCDQIVTIYTNDASGGAPAETIVMVGDAPYLWTANDGVMGIVNVLATNLTDLYITNASAAIANFDFRCIYDPTP